MERKEELNLFLRSYKLSEKAETLILDWITACQNNEIVSPLIFYGGNNTGKTTLLLKIKDLFDLKWQTIPFDQKFEKNICAITKGITYFIPEANLSIFPVIQRCLECGINILILMSKIPKEVLSIASKSSQIISKKLEAERKRTQQVMERPLHWSQIPEVNIIELHLNFKKKQKRKLKQTIKPKRKLKNPKNSKSTSQTSTLDSATPKLASQELS